MPSKRKTKARGRPQLDSGDDTDHGSVVSATGKTTVKVVDSEKKRSSRWLNGLKNTLSSTSSRASCPCSTTNYRRSS